MKTIKLASILLTAILCFNVFANEMAKLHSRINNQDVEMSVLSIEESNHFFSLMANDAEIPFNYPKDGCFVRAHMMAHKLEEQGIIVAKSFLIGRIMVPTSMGPEVWRYHVAPMVMVRDQNEQLVPTIFDPSLFDHPVSLDEFRKLLSRSRGSRIVSEFYTNRFSISPENQNDIYSEYQPGLEAAVNSMLAHIRSLP